MRVCNKHGTVMTYKAGKENVLFCKKCAKKTLLGQTKKKPWWKFW